MMISKSIQKNMASLESMMGCFHDEDNIFSSKKIIDIDEREEFPAAACQKLDEWGFNEFYIPGSCKGKLIRFDELIMLMRLVARRDLTIAIGHGKTFLGASPIWVAGTPQQKEYTADLIRGKYPISLGLTEKGHGSDLIANEVKAVYADNQYFISGTKWLINNATRGRAFSLLVQTDNKSSSRSHTFFILDKDTLKTEQFNNLAKIKTHGIRGADISGIEFFDAPVNTSDMIGSIGQGLEIALKSLQISRILCCSLSLGALDMALRTTTKFTLNRRLYNDTIINIMHVKETLLDAYTDLLINEVLSVCIAKCIHVAPKYLSLYSAVAKYFIPKQTDKQIHALSRILGARHYLREEHDNGIFQKIMRDNMLIGVFDGSTFVNAQSICSQLSSIVKRNDKITHDDKLTISRLFDINSEVPYFDESKLQLSAHGKDLILLSLSILDGKIFSGDTLYTLLKNLIDIKNNFSKKVQSSTILNEKLSTTSEIIVNEYCAIISAICCLNFLFYNRTSLTEDKQRVLELSLHKLICKLSNVELSVSSDDVLASLTELYYKNKLFSFFDMELL